MPSQAQSTGQGTPQGTGQGTDTQLVPYQDVLADYKSAALNQVDRQVIPDADRALVAAYFTELGK